MSLGKSITLSTGAKIPQIGLGTWQSWDKSAGIAVEIALRNGYRHLDLAMIYENQEEVGAALKKVFDEGKIKREDIFITSKLWNNSHQPDQVEKELDQTLKQLGLTYLDLYLIHWPAAFAPNKGFYPAHPTIAGEVELDTTTTLVDTWKAMIALPQFKVRAVGVSNFSVEHLEGLIKATGVVPAVNQIEAHPYLQQNELYEYAKEKNIHITAYSPLGGNTLGKPKVTDDTEVIAIAERLGATPAQVLIAWAAQKGFSVIPKSTQEERLKANFKQIELSAEDVKKISEIGAGKYTRYNIPFRYEPKWDINIFNEPQDKVANFNVKIA